MSKKLKTDAIANELSGSVFFRKQPSEQKDTPAPTPVYSQDVDSSPASTSDSTTDIAPDSDPASLQDSSSDSTLDSTRASTADITRDITKDIKTASKLASRNARRPAREQARPKAHEQVTSLSSQLASSSDIVDAIYRIVRKSGKEISYVRLTEREKSELTNILATIHQKHGYKLHETELIRIAICNLLADYAEHGTESLLMRVVVDLKD